MLTQVAQITAKAMERIAELMEVEGGRRSASFHQCSAQRCNMQQSACCTASNWLDSHIGMMH
jgi:hypothetical protein